MENTNDIEGPGGQAAQDKADFEAVRSAYEAQLLSEEAKDNEMIALLKRQLKLSRLLSTILGGILVLMVILSVILVPKTAAALSEANKTISSVNETLIPKLEELDMNQINQAVRTLDKAVSDLDVESLNNGVGELTEAVQGIDVEGLNTAIDNLNTAVQPLVRLAQIMGGR